MIRRLDDLIVAAQQRGPISVVVAAADDVEVLVSIEEAIKLGICMATLIGDRVGIESLAREHGLTLPGTTVVHEPETERAARAAVTLARQGKARVIIKGRLKTSELLHACLDRETGIRGEHLLLHVGLFEIPGFDRLIYMSDTGVILHPTLEEKLVITRTAVEVARRFGVEWPRVAILSAYEVVEPDMPASIEALALAQMARQGWIEGADVAGPLPLDVAVSPTAAARKGIAGPVAGQADILIVPGVEAGNALAKSVLFLAGGRMAGLVLGAKVPILINSRADSAETRLLSLAMAVLLANEHQSSR